MKLARGEENLNPTQKEKLKSITTSLAQLEKGYVIDLTARLKALIAEYDAMKRGGLAALR